MFDPSAFNVMLAQLSPVIGGFLDNFAMAREMFGIAKTKDRQPELIVFPELFTCGYPPLDLLDRPDFIRQCLELDEYIIELVHDYKIAAVWGTVRRSPDGGLYNSFIFQAPGQKTEVGHKMLLPTYDVFDERRWFKPGTEFRTFILNGRRIAIFICEDLWGDKNEERYDIDPLENLNDEPVDLIVTINASPYQIRKHERIRLPMFRKIAQTYRVPVVYVNQVGGYDDILFDGASFVMDRTGALVYQCPAFQAVWRQVIFGPYDNTEVGVGITQICEEEAEIFSALVMGTREYCRRNNFKSALIGLSGGIDSALVAVIAKEALGEENVFGIGMPGPCSSEGSVKDAEELAKNLGIDFDIIPITDAYESMQKVLQVSGVAAENLQARLRGTVLMSKSNAMRHIVLTTGNKSEIAVGYCTLYGDMCGGLAVISDVPKTMVYRLAKWYNYNHSQAIIPISTIEKPPSAELSPGQLDSDSLPDYEVLDPMIERIIVENEIDREQTEIGIAYKIDRNEYKRRQAAPGLRITSKAFGSGRKIPLGHSYRPFQRLFGKK